MKWGFFFILFLWITSMLQAQSFSTVKVEDIERKFFAENDTLYIFNFWATWCKPCVAELPLFDEAARSFASSPVRIVLVSLNFRSQIQKQLLPFLSSRKPVPEVWLLDEQDPDNYIERVSPDWSGAIPFTLMVRAEKFQAYEGEFTREELFSEIKKMLNQ